MVDHVTRSGRGVPASPVVDSSVNARRGSFISAPRSALRFSVEYSSDSHSTSNGDFSMAPQHPPRFLKIVEDAKTRVRETTVDEIKARLDRGDKFQLVDVREESEFQKDHLPGAIHMGKGVIERDIEHEVPDLNAPLVLYCGGGFRSALAADNLQKMGYTNVISMDGGVRGWREKGYPFTKD
jgi:rhodanese-related sulfurtransferase